MPIEQPNLILMIPLGAWPTWKRYLIKLILVIVSFIVRLISSLTQQTCMTHMIQGYILV